MIRRRSLIAVLPAAALLLAGCGDGGSETKTSAAVAADTSSLEALVAAAKKEGVVRVYTGLTPPDIETMTKGFQDKYGIKLEVTRLGGSDAMNRFDAESKSGARTADILIISDAPYLEAKVDEKLLVGMPESGVLEYLPKLPDRAFSADKSTVVIQLNDAGIIYNTDKVKADEVPKSWKDLLDPKWKGRIVGVPGDMNRNQLLIWSIVEKAEGAEYFDTLKGQVKRVYPNVVPLNDAVAAGEGDIGLLTMPFLVNALAKKGAKVAFQPIHPNVVPLIVMNVVTKAENPNGARLLAHYLLSEEGSKAVNNAATISPYQIDEKLPNEWHLPTTEEVKAAEEKRAHFGTLK